MIIRVLLTLFLASLTMNSYAQIKIHGRIVDSKTKQGVEAINIMLYNKTQTKIYSFTPSKADGSYSMSLDGKTDSLKIVITGVHIEPQVHTIVAQSQRFDFFVVSKVLKIKEVIVKSRPIRIKRQSDTLTYNVASFTSKGDRSIEDVLKNMPGIEVRESGEILYNGKAISQFTIEGLDMLGGRYSMASRNIQAKDVASVDVYENHQAIKALRDIVVPDKAAINIKLKDSAKGVWTGVVQLGVGYKPWMWDGSLTAMYFGKKFQTLNTYKANNTGKNVASELTSYYGGMGEFGSPIGVQLPTTPPLGQNRYLQNDVHSVATNFITKIKEDVTFKVNASYSHDYLTGEGESTTKHFISGVEPIIITESTYAAQESDNVNLDLNFESNKEKSFLDNTLKFKGSWDRDLGRVQNDDQHITQRFKLPSIAFENNLQMIFPVKGKTSFGLNSNVNYTSQPSSLRITPMIYPEVFDSPEGYHDAQQLLNTNRFTTHNSVYIRFKLRNWDFSVNAGVNAHIEWMNSGLTAMDGSGNILPAVDSMSNDILWRKLNFTVGPSANYRVGSGLNIAAMVFVDFMSLGIEDKMRNEKQDLNKLIISPYLSFNGAITYDLKYTVNASYNELYGGLYDSYGGFIMSDYRSISQKDGDIRHTKMQNYGASLNYANALKLLFGGVSANYWRTNNNITYGTSYVGSLSYIESYAIPTSAHGFNTEARISKQIDPIRTMINLSGGYSRSWNMIVRQGDLMDTQNDIINAKLGLNINFHKVVSLDYSCEYIRSMSQIEGIGKLEPIDHIVQKAELYFNFTDDFTGSVSGSHYYNGTIASKDRNMFFLDAMLSYKTKRFEYILEARNLLNTSTYSSAYTTDITNYVYSYNLRPMSIMFMVKFNLN